MEIREKIESEIIIAMKKKDEDSLSLYRSLKAAIKNAEIDAKGDFTDEDVLSVLDKQAKQRKDSIEQFEKGGRDDLADKEKAELKLIENFLPEKMSEDEVREIVKKKVANMGEEAQFGQVMGACMADLKGKADGAVVQRVVKEEMEA